jgi:signal peptidase II
MQATRGAPVAQAAPGELAPRRTTTCVVTALAVLAADVVSKVAIVATMQPRERVHLVGRLLQLTETRNSGAAFSIGTGATVLLSAVAVVVVAVIVRTAPRLRTRSWAVTLGLLLGGALGNLGDRLFRAPGPFRGWVVDWIQLPHWPTFNLADSAIVVGACLAILLATRGVTFDAEHDREDDAHEAGEVDSGSDAEAGEA